MSSFERCLEGSEAVSITEVLPFGHIFSGMKCLPPAHIPALSAGLSLCPVGWVWIIFKIKFRLHCFFERCLVSALAARFLLAASADDEIWLRSRGIGRLRGSYHSHLRLLHSSIFVVIRGHGSSVCHSSMIYINMRLAHVGEVIIFICGYSFQVEMCTTGTIERLY